MGTTWIAVAHRAGARVFENRGRGKGLTLVKQLENEAGRLRNQEIDTDRPGSTRGTSRGTSYTGALVNEENAHERAATNFARELARELERGRNEHAFVDLVLVAEPRFLGMLRGSLDRGTENLLLGTVAKDLAHLEARDLPRHLTEVVAV